MRGCRKMWSQLRRQCSRRFEGGGRQCFVGRCGWVGFKWHVQQAPRKGQSSYGLWCGIIRDCACHRVQRFAGDVEQALNYMIPRMQVCVLQLGLRCHGGSNQYSVKAVYAGVYIYICIYTCALCATVSSDYIFCYQENRIQEDGVFFVTSIFRRQRDSHKKILKAVGDGDVQKRTGSLPSTISWCGFLKLERSRQVSRYY